MQGHLDYPEYNIHKSNQAIIGQLSDDTFFQIEFQSNQQLS